MSDQITVPSVTNPENVENVRKNASKPRKTRATNGRVEFTRIIAQHAKRRGIDTTRAGKEVRAKARREFDALVKLDPSLSKAKSHANDGNRWPSLNERAAQHILTSRKAK